MFSGKYLQFVCFLGVVSYSVSVSVSSRGSSISISPDGGYNDIVIKIKKSVPEDSCKEILDGIKVRFSTYLFQLKCKVYFRTICKNF